ncbi:MAG: CBS domain-containing protein [Lutibacter sp.]|nr:CBS domain-containing protein [Lutibacter sp.]MBP9601134.1 CBS domain-containing protein [Lutibacter sp.]
MRSSEYISKIMTRKLITLKITDDLFKAEKLFKEHRIRHIPVVDNQKHIVGMLSLTDLNRISFLDSYDEDEIQIDNAIYEMLCIEQLMVKSIVKITSDVTIKDAAEILAKNEFHALPVVDNGVLVGIVTTTDLLLYLISYCESEEI